LPIAESYERESTKETIRFLVIAKGSAGERRTQIYIGMESGYIGKEQGERWFKEVLRISGMLSSQIIKLKERKLSA